MGNDQKSSNVTVIHEPTPPPRLGGWGRGKLEVKVRLMDASGKQVGENASTRSAVNERIPTDYRKY